MPSEPAVPQVCRSPRKEAPGPNCADVLPKSPPDPHKVLFHELVAHSNKDAQAQEGLVELIGDVLHSQVARNDAALQRDFGGKPARVTVFHGNKPPDIGVKEYLDRMRVFAGCSACCFVLGLRYIERLRESDGAYELNSFNMHRLILTGVMVAAKFVDDFYFSNNYWSKVGGIPNEELNGLELELLFLLNFSLHTSRGEYEDYVAHLRRRHDEALAVRPDALVSAALQKMKVLDEDDKSEHA